MTVYELRLSGGRIQGLLEEVGDRIWVEVAACAHGREADGYEAVHEAVSTYFEARLRAMDPDEGGRVRRWYRPLCVDTRAEAAGDGGLSRTAERYGLELEREDLTAFLYGLAESVWRQLLREEAVEAQPLSPEVRWQMADAVREVLGPHIFAAAEPSEREEPSRSRKADPATTSAGS